MPSFKSSRTKISLSYLATLSALFFSCSTLASDSKGFLRDLRQTDYTGTSYYVIPHSHTDAGWLTSFEDYYNTRTRNILNSVHSYLSDHYSNDDAEMAKQAAAGEKERFIWADYAFFIKWWN